MSELEKTVAYQEGQIQALTKLVRVALSRVPPDDLRIMLGGLGHPCGTDKAVNISRGGDLSITSDRSDAIAAGWGAVMDSIRNSFFGG